MTATGGSATGGPWRREGSARRVQCTAPVPRARVLLPAVCLQHDHGPTPPAALRRTHAHNLSHHKHHHDLAHIFLCNDLLRPSRAAVQNIRLLLGGDKMTASNLAAPQIMTGLWLGNGLVQQDELDTWTKGIPPTLSEGPAPTLLGSDLRFRCTLIRAVDKQPTCSLPTHKRRPARAAHAPPASAMSDRLVPGVAACRALAVGGEGAHSHAGRRQELQQPARGRRALPQPARGGGLCIKRRERRRER